MVDCFNVIRQDFAAAAGAFAEGDYSQMNVYSNRLMGNCMLGRAKEYGVFGLFLKTVSVDFLKLGGNAESQSALKPAAGTLITKLNQALKSDFDLNEVWSAYFIYINGSRKIFMRPVEKQVYTDDTKFTEGAFALLLDEFFADPTLYEERGQVLKGILNEAERLVKNHGATERDMVLHSLLIALSRLDDYLAFACSDKEAACRREALSPWIERIGKWRKAEEKLPFREGTEILNDIVIEWRKAFVRFTELPKVGTGEERKIELPPEAKKRIGDTIAEALKKDLAPKKK